MGDSCEDEEILAYVDCFAGAAGDMILGALVDAGLDLAALEARLKSMGPVADQWALRATKVHKSAGALAAVQVHVDVLTEQREERNLDDVRVIIESGTELPRAVKDQALRAFEALARAEAHVHGTTVDQIHFHEVGAIDSIIDTVGVVMGLHMLGVTQVFCSSIPMAQGYVRAAHGLLPVPAPATLRLLQEGFVVHKAPDVMRGELVTPTAASLLRVLVGEGGFGSYPPCRWSIERAGSGAGTREPDEYPNICRVMIGRATRPGSRAVAPSPVDESSKPNNNAEPGNDTRHAVHGRAHGHGHSHGHAHSHGHGHSHGHESSSHGRVHDDGKPSVHDAEDLQQGQPAQRGVNAGAQHSGQSAPADFPVSARDGPYVAGSAESSSRGPSVAGANLEESLVPGKIHEKSVKTTPSRDSELVVMECNVDDMTGELAGHLIGELLLNGAIDAWWTSIFMKKNRPALMLSVLCHPKLEATLTARLLRETTTLGVRRHRVQRFACRRQMCEVDTVFGTVRAKLAFAFELEPGGTTDLASHADGEGDLLSGAKPEFDDCVALAQMHGVPVKTVLAAAHAALDVARDARAASR